jgi:integrase
VPVRHRHTRRHRIVTSQGLTPKRRAERRGRAHFVAPVRGAFTYANRYDVVTVDPTKLLRDKDLPERAEREVYEWTLEEINHVIEASRDRAARKIAKADYSGYVQLAIYTGLRLGEAAGLQWRDIEDLYGDRPVLHVRRQRTRYAEVDTPKTKKGVRRIPLWPDAVAVLQELHAEAFGTDPFAQLRSKDSEQYVLPEYTHRNIQRRGWEPVREEVGLPDHVTFHDLRHCFASLASSRNVPLNVLSNVMGHANVNVTANVYVHLFSRETAEDAFRDAGRKSEAI